MRREILAGALAVLVAATARGEEPQLLATEAAGILKVTTERRVALRGIEGSLTIEAGPPGEMRFLSTEPDNRDRDLPLAAWEDGSTLVLRPPQGEAPRKRRVEVTVPPDLAVEVDTKDGKVMAYGLGGTLEIRGERVDVDAQSCRGSTTLEIAGGVVRISNAGGPTTIRGTGVDVELATGGGTVALYVTGKRVKIRDFLGTVEGELQDVDLTLENTEGPVNVRQRGGAATVKGLRQGGSLEMAHATLRLSEAEGDVSIRSDSEVQLRETKATFRLDLFGGTLRVADGDGKLEATAEGTEIVMEHVTGGVKLDARSGQVRLSDVFGEVSVTAQLSDVKIEKASGKLTIAADGGDVQIDRTSAVLDVQSSGGSVRLLEHGGPVKIRADGREVEVAWRSLPAGQESLVQNNGGDVVVRFLGGSGAHVTAEAQGRVETDLPQVVVERGGQSAQGFVNSARQPSVVVKAAGNVELTASGGSEEEP